MITRSRFLRKFVLLTSLSLMTLTNSGCYGTWAELLVVFWDAGAFFGTTGPIPVTPYYSQMIEDTYWEEERYKRVPILDPVEGEHAPLFCMDPPSPDHVMRSLPDDPAGGVPFLAETHLNNVRIVVEPIVDRIGECRFYPMVGPAKLHYCHYKCTIYYDRVIRSHWPVPFTHVDQSQEVTYIDKDHLIRCAGPAQ